MKIKGLTPRRIVSFLGIDLSTTEKWRVTIRPRFFAIIGGVFVVFLIFLVAMAKYSTSPTFCKSCHIMKPYYDAWNSSKHNKVACVKCHYPPEKGKEVLWKKFQALSQVAKYITRTYSSKPYAEIEDSSCLRSGCHATRLLEGKLTTKSGIKFDHRPHLTQVRRGRQLRCVSCHSQIVVGKHVEVTWDTCYLCHFKGMKEGRKLEPLAGCLSCHSLPEKPFVLQNITYRHTDFVTKRKVSCNECHIDVVEGSGEAPKERCFTCHNQPEKLAKYKDTLFIHEDHMVKHNVACFHCHKEIRHGFRAAVKEKGVFFECTLCHLDKHNAQRQIYIGKGGEDVSEMASPMYLANVDCVGCHNVVEPDSYETALHGKTFFASEESCLKCHGESYKGIIADSKSAISETIVLLKEKLNEAKSHIKNLKKGNTKHTTEVLVSKVEHNITFIEVAHGVHNIYYSSELLRKSDALLEEIKELIGIELKNLSDNKLISGKFCATMCHQKVGVKVPAETVKFENKNMPHKKHYEEVGLTCVKCHEFGQHKQISLKQVLPCKDCHQ